VNNRFLDCSVRLPRVYTACEDALKAQVQKHISRGKVDVYITIDASQADDVTISVNKSLLEAYVSALKEIGELAGVSADTNAMNLAKLQDVLTVQKKETDVEVLKADMVAALEEALVSYDCMRETEGRKLYEDILSRAAKIEEYVGIIETASPETVSRYRERLEARMREVLESKNLDEARIITEAAIFADKVAVDEETVRLRSHISQLRELLESREPVGRKLDFLVQEFNREANTIGSKCSDAAMAKVVVDMKSEIEKIREQIQNVE